MAPQDNQDFVALVTGGASGMGEATADLLVRKGFKVAIFDLPTSNGKEVAQKLGDSALFIPGDVTKKEEVEVCIDQIKKRFGRLNVVANFAGNLIMHHHSDENYPEVFEKHLKVHVQGTVMVIHQALPLMKENRPDAGGERGVIINACSVFAMDGGATFSGYCSSKGAILGLNVPLARELGEFGIRVNCLQPGFIQTPLLNPIPQGVVPAMLEKQIFPKTIGRPEDVAYSVLFLIRNKHINATSIRIDGGFRL